MNINEVNSIDSLFHVLAQLIRLVPNLRPKDIMVHPSYYSFYCFVHLLKLCIYTISWLHILSTFLSLLAPVRVEKVLHALSTLYSLLKRWRNLRYIDLIFSEATPPCIRTEQNLYQWSGCTMVPRTEIEWKKTSIQLQFYSKFYENLFKYMHKHRMYLPNVWLICFDKHAENAVFARNMFGHK